MLKLEMISGKLCDSTRLEQLLTSDEIIKERITNTQLRAIYFHTANFTMYSVEDGVAYLYLGGREANPILGNLEEACRQISGYYDYTPSREEVEAVRESARIGETVRVMIEDLKLRTYNSDTAYIEIDTTNYAATLNEAQKRVAEKAYGSMQMREGETNCDFEAAMEMLREEGIKTTRVYMLRQDYVQEKAAEQIIVRACWLNDTKMGSNIWACNYNVTIKIGLCGIPKTAEEKNIQSYLPY